MIEGILGISEEAASGRGEKEAPDGAQQRGAVRQKTRGAQGAVFQAAADSGESCPALFSTFNFNHRLSPFPPVLPREDSQSGLG